MMKNDLKLINCIEMKKIFILIILIAGITSSGFSQHRYLYNHYQINPVILNPGATGFQGGQDIFLNYKNTWAGHPGSPNTFSFSADGNIGDRVGLGAFIMSDTYGALQTIKGQLSYAYNVKGESYDFGIGFTTEYIDYRVKGSLGDGPVDRNDPYLALRQDGDQFFEMAFGVHGLLHDQFLISVTLPSLLRTQLNSRDNQIEEDKLFDYIVGLSYIYRLPEYKMTVTPGLLMKKLWKFNTMIDANLLFTFYDGQFTSGLTYGIGDHGTMGFLLGTKLENFNLYYSYNFTNKEFQTYNSGAHELTVGYKFR
jgi:type IX secretion system PorP/SprF family membrane protein